MKVIITTRKLAGYETVVHSVYREPDQPHDLDNVEQYLYELTNENIEKFKKQFVEFNNATFISKIYDAESHHPY